MKTSFILLRIANIRTFLAILIVLFGTCAYGQNIKRPKKNKEKAEKVRMTIPVKKQTIRKVEQDNSDINQTSPTEKEITYESWMTDGFAIKAKAKGVEYGIDEDLLLEVEAWMTDTKSWKCD